MRVLLSCDGVCVLCADVARRPSVGLYMCIVVSFTVSSCFAPFSCFLLARYSTVSAAATSIPKMSTNLSVTSNFAPWIRCCQSVRARPRSCIPLAVPLRGAQEEGIGLYQPLSPPLSRCRHLPVPRTSRKGREGGRVLSSTGYRKAGGPGCRPFSLLWMSSMPTAPLSVPLPFFD